MEFDLTTTDGRKRALDAFDRYGWLLAPTPWIFRKLGQWISSSGTIEDQKAAAISLIKAGRENGVDEMKITLDQTVGLDFGSDFEGIPITAKLGKSGKMVMEIKYRHS